MAETKQVKVGSVTYNVAQAPAVQQKTLLLLIGAKVALHSASGRVDEINTTMLFGTLLSLPEDTLDQIADIVLARAIVNGKDSTVEVQDFQGRMVEYVQLIAEAIKVNLQDFFTYLDKNNAENRNKSQQVVKAQ